MDPQAQFCHNPRCWAYGRAGEGHIVIHSRREGRYQCRRCRKPDQAARRCDRRSPPRGRGR